MLPGTVYSIQHTCFTRLHRSVLVPVRSPRESFFSRISGWLLQRLVFDEILFSLDYLKANEGMGVVIFFKEKTSDTLSETWYVYVSYKYMPYSYSSSHGVQYTLRHGRFGHGVLYRREGRSVPSFFHDSDCV